MPVAIISILAALAGFFVGRGSSTNLEASSDGLNGAQSDVQKLTESRDALQAKLSKIELDLRSVTNIDIGEYLRLQDAEERARKLGDLLGQTFLVLMNHALVSTTPEQTDALKALTADHSSAGAAPANGVMPEADTGVEAVPTDANQPLESRPAVAAPKSTWNQVEAELPHVTLASADNFLAKAAIPDLRAEIKNGRSFEPDDPRVSQIQGLFTGDIRFMDAKREPLTVEIETAATEIEGGRLKGTYSVRTYKNGERTGNSSSNGNLEGIMNTSGPSSALIVQFSPDQFMQLYYLASADSLVGNVYEMSNAKDSKLIGRVKLNR